MHDQIPYREDNNNKYDLIEFVENPDTRCPYIILVDSSSSMEGEPIKELNNGLRLFKQELLKNELAAKRVELGVISFGTTAENLTGGFVSPKNYNPVDIEAEGVTKMGDAVKLAHTLLEMRKSQYKQAGVSYYRPWIVLITDGAPTDEDGYQLEYDSPAFREIVNIVHTGVKEKKFSFFAIGVGDGVDMDALSRICTPERQPLKLSGMRFAELFKWLSDSATSVSSSVIGTQVALPSVSGWAATEA